MQVNGKVGNSYPTPHKPLNRSTPKFAWVITSGTPTLCKDFIMI